MASTIELQTDVFSNHFVGIREELGVQNFRWRLKNNMGRCQQMSEKLFTFGPLLPPNARNYLVRIMSTLFSLIVNDNIVTVPANVGVTSHSSPPIQFWIAVASNR